MEQLTKEFFRFEAYAEGNDGNVVPLSIWISHPDFDDARGHCCLVICSFVRLKPYFIFGADEEQARELAFQFIRNQVLHKSERLLDSSGNKIVLEANAPFKT